MARDTEELIIQLKSLFDDDGFKAMSQSLQDLDERVKEFEEEAKKLKRVSQLMEGIGQSAKKMQLTVTAPIVAAGTAAVMGASKIEKFTASFTTMLGNEKKAETLINQLNRMAAVTPFDPEPLIKSSQTLLAYQIELEDVEGTLKMLGDASSGSAEALESLSVAYGKIATKGKASMEELNIMIDRGVPILEYLGQTLNKTGNEIIEMTSKGEISFKDVNAAFQKMTSEGGVFYNGMATASETLAGKTSTLKGNIDLLAAGLAEDLLPIIKSAVDALNSIVVGFQGMDESQKAAIITTAAVAAALPPVITAVTTMTKSIKAMTAAMKAGNMAALANPYTAIGVAIAAIVAGLVMWIKKQNDINSLIKDLEKRTEKTAAALEKAVKMREAAKNAAEDEAEAAEKEAAALEAQEALRVRLREQLKDTAKTVGLIVSKEGDAERLLQKYVSALSRMQSDKDRGFTKTWGVGDIAGARIRDIDTEIVKTERALNSFKAQILELKEESETAMTGLIEGVAGALREGFDIEAVRQNATENELNLWTQILERAQALNEELAKQAEIEKEKNKPETSAKAKDEKDRYDKLLEIHRKYTENVKKIDSGLLLDIEKAALESENQKNQAAFEEAEAYLKRIENLGKTRYDQLAEEHAKYLENKEKIESGLLLESEKAALESENRKLKASYEAYENYSNQIKKVNSDEMQLSFLNEYFDAKEKLLKGDIATFEDYYTTLENAENIYYENSLESFINYLKRKKELGQAFTEAEADAWARYEALENQDDPLAKKLSDLANIENNLSVAAGTFVTYMQTGNVAAEQLGKNFAVATDAASQIVGNIADFTANMDDANAKTELIGKSIAAGLEAVGEIAGNIFSAITDDIAEQIESLSDEIAGNLQKELDRINDYYDEQQKAADAAKAASLQSLKDEYAARGIIIETGLETELEKAQEAYDEALKALSEYEDETASTRQAQLDAYKEQLAARNDEDIQQALEAKQRELDAVEDNKKAELQKNADTKKAELEKQKILEEAENKKNEIEKQADYERRLAEYNSEVERLTRTHDLEVEQFNIKKAQDIANIWISQAAGIATIWATAMQLGPVAGPIAAGVLTGTLATVAGVQTGLVAAQSPPPAPTMPEPPAKYMTGGVIPGNDNTDSTLLLASSGERVLTQDQNALFERLVENLEGGGTPPVINVHVYIDGDEIDIEKKLIDIQRKDRWSGRWGM